MTSSTTKPLNPISEDLNPQPPERVVPPSLLNRGNTEDTVFGSSCQGGGGGTYPEGWEVVRLGDVCQKVLGGGTPSTTCEDYWNGSIPWVTSADIVDLRTIEPRKFITEEAIQKSATNLVPKGSIVVATRVGLGKVGITLFDMCTSQDCQSLILDNRKSIAEYILYKVYLQAQEFTKQSRGSTIQGITKSQLVEIEIPLPPLEEQKKIAEILSTWDHGIDKLSGLIERKKHLKKGLMQNLLTGKVRFKEFVVKQGYQETELGLIPEDWKVVRLGEFVNLGKTKYNPLTETSSLPCVELEHIDQGTGKILGFVDSKQQLSIKNLFEPNCCLFGKLRPYLRKYALPDFKGVCSSEIWVFLPRTKSCRNDFLFNLIQTDSFIQTANKTCGSKMPRADWDTLKETPIPLPPLEEQKKIAEILSRQEQEIEFLSKQLERLKEQKKGLMQVLLTGRVRV